MNFNRVLSPDLVPEVAGQLEVAPRVPALPLAEVVEPRGVQVAKTYVGTNLFHHEFIKTARITKYATWDGSFSAVTDRNVGKKISCFIIFRDLHKDQIDLEKFPDFCTCSHIFLSLQQAACYSHGAPTDVNDVACRLRACVTA